MYYSFQYFFKYKGPRGSDGGNDDENNDSAEPCDPSVGTNCKYN